MVKFFRRILTFVLGFLFILPMTKVSSAQSYNVPSSIQYGDLNGAPYDKVTLYDAQLVAQYVAGLTTLTPTQMQEAEVSSINETSPTINDAHLIAQYAIGSIKYFPVQQTPSSIASCLATNMTISVKSYGAKGDGITDDTVAIQNALNAATPGSIVLLPSGQYIVSNVLTMGNPDVVLVGNGATLVATNPAYQALDITGSHCAVVGVVFQGVGTTRLTTPASSKIIGQGNYLQLIGNTINGGASAGIFIYVSQNYLIWGNSVSNTLADGIHNTNGSSENGSANGIIENNTVTHSGDDLISVVSYNYPSILPVSNVLIANNIVSGNNYGRGITVVGGQGITFANNTISNVNQGAGIYVSQEEAEWNSVDSQNILVEGNTISNIEIPPYVNTPDQHAAINIGGNTMPPQNVLVENNTVTNTGYGGIRIYEMACNEGIVNNQLSQIAGTPLQVTPSDCTASQNMCSGNTLSGYALTNSNCAGTVAPTVTGSNYVQYGQGATPVGSWKGCLNY